LAPAADFKEFALKLRMLMAVGSMSLLLAGAASSKETPGQAVDSGTFGVFVNGQRVATETFSVQQTPAGSAASSQVKAEGGTDPGQRSDLKLSPGGDLIRYEWHDLSAGKSELTVAPNDQFLIEHVTTAAGEKTADQPFMMPTSTMVLDNNSFVQRELLVWRYLGSSCKQDKGKMQCPTTPAQFGVLVPQERVSMSVSLQVVGKEKVKIKGTDRDLLKVSLKQESGDWLLYVDDQDRFKLIRITVPANNAEIVRD
jgi:hypothetical protein